MTAIIDVTSLSKKYLISHEAKEKYTALRDVVTDRVKKVFSFKPSFSNSSIKEDFWALKDLNFQVQRGDRLGIIGRNGAGKSTLLKILSRITEPTAGTIRIKGRVASLLEVGTGFHPELTGRENIFLNGAILGMSRFEIRKKFDEIVAFAEIERFLDTPVKRYSSGMYVRLAFAVAAHMEPEILVVDEVLAVGDAQFQKKCLGKMEDVSNNEGRTVLFVSHNMGVVSQLCNKGMLLSKGGIVVNDDIKSVVERYLRSDDVINKYVASSSIAKKNFIHSVEVTDDAGNSNSDFKFDESISLKFSFKVSERTMGLQIGIAMEDKFNNRVFTVLKEIEYFREADGLYYGMVKLPAGLFAPNYYNFVVALWTRDRRIFDVATGICPVMIHDNGTELSLYEGVEYGNVIINPAWTSV